jgi:hypothetical protein
MKTITSFLLPATALKKKLNGSIVPITFSPKKVKQLHRARYLSTPKNELVPSF